MAWVAGIDGCKAGWVCVLRNLETARTNFEILTHVSAVSSLLEKPKIVAIDVPIGLLDKAVRRGRQCDRLAREILRQPRARSIFSPPVRQALKSTTHPEACDINSRSSPDQIGISRQCFCLFPKIREVDDWIDANKQSVVYEIHPELSFAKMNGGSLQHSKKDKRGLTERRALLFRNDFEAIVNAAEAHLLGVGKDDVYDACAACWTAERILRGDAEVIPTNPPRDRRKLRMEMRY
ncbi:MAG TPA: DUF429 domain-containing protein [Candidatus Angelobacter sp.]|jgi:predicted RNase H-like nuclease|nr:DUF429 domain-containing protein [Candidatus Angelobacter sp.]